jgi:nitroreductase
VSTSPVDTLKEADASNQGMFDSAPVCIYVGVDDRLFFEKYSGPLDAACAMQNMLLVAHYRGLGGCLVYQGEFANRKELEEKYRVPEYCTIYCAVLLGYPDESPDTPARMPVEEITTYVE